MSCCDEPNNHDGKSVLANLPPIMVAPFGVGLRCLEFTLLPGMPIEVHDDGSIEYEPREGFIPAEINGYTRDEGNPYLFHPEWPECEMRYHGTKLTRDGFIDVLMVCNCNEAPQFGKHVTHEDCQQCPLRKSDR